MTGLAIFAALAAISATAQRVNPAPRKTPPRVAQAVRFLAQRGWPRASAGSVRSVAGLSQAANQAATPGSSVWQALGPIAVQSQNFGLVTGRVAALALDPSDASGNTLYVGTTGGGVWKSQNAGTSSLSNIAFAPLTDNLAALSGMPDASISIGAVTVQPGATGVVLAGTGDPNDVLDSYYGAGILQSGDGGNTWSLIQTTSDVIDGLSIQDYSFIGEGFAGFAWSTTNPQLVVAAVSQAYEGTLVNAVWPGSSYAGLYYSTQGGEPHTWHLATISDGSGGSGAVVQGPNYTFASPDGNAATAVVWNPIRKLFFAAVRYHGYYQSADGITWTRLAAQPGAGLTTLKCPTKPGYTGSPDCPIYRGALAVNPVTGDTFAWTVGGNDQDQGLWQDQCAASAGVCTTQIAFATQWGTAALEAPGTTTIQDGGYNLTLAALPSGQETLLLAGDNDLWETTCPYSQGCTWRNTTNSTVGFCAQVGKFQHALAWNASNPLEIFVGNDSGLWRSTDAIGETGTACSSSDALHFQNLNGSLGSLAEVVSISQVGATPYTMMAGLGANGTVGVKSGTGITTDWPEIFSGMGGPVAIDPDNSAKWYVNDENGVSIYMCSQLTPCTPSAFGTTPVVSDADVGGDGLTMNSSPAPFLVDAIDHSQLLVGTCRVWRGPADGSSWTESNAISSLILDNKTSSGPCSGDALIDSMAAMQLASGNEIVYVGLYGWADGNTTLPGNVFSMTYSASTGSWSVPANLTSNTVSNDKSNAMNRYGMSISSIFIDPHDAPGNTVYITVSGMNNVVEDVQTVYGSTDGGAHWTSLMANLPSAPANSLVVDPASSSTVYVATDVGVYSTQAIGSCTTVTSGCWAPMGSGLPNAPVVELSAAPTSASVPNLVAATYGRGIWMTPLLGAGGPGTGQATDTLSATVLTFPSTDSGQLSLAQTVTLTNSGSVPLTSIAVSVSGEFQQTNSCTANLAANSSCTISVQFAPTTTGVQSGTLYIADITSTQAQTVALSGTSLAPPVLGINPTSLSFTGQMVGQPSPLQTVTVTNTGGAPLANVGFAISPAPGSGFSCSPNACSAYSCATLAPNAKCIVPIVFTPTTAGGASAQLAISDNSGITAVSVPLTGNGVAPAGINVNPVQLLFPIVSPGQSSLAQTVTLTNTGGSTATSLALSVASPFNLVQDTCGSSLTAGSSCSTGVVFSPSVAGAVTGALSIASPALATGSSVPLSGTGGTPGSVQFQPIVLTFAETGVGQTSSASAVTITNSDSVTSLNSLALAVSPGFLLVSNTCPTTLPPLSNCTASIEFAPASAGTQQGALTVTSSALTTGSFLQLTGMGFSFASAPQGSSSQTVVSGQPAYFPLTIQPINGSQGLFTLHCGSLPPNSTCNFSPSNVIAVGAGGQGNPTVEIVTGQSTTSARRSQPERWRLLPLWSGLILLPLGLSRRRRALLLVAVLAILAGGVSSCTASSGGAVSVPVNTSGVTPSGTYYILVNITSNPVSTPQQVKLTLVVD